MECEVSRCSCCSEIQLTGVSVGGSLEQPGFVYPLLHRGNRPTLTAGSRSHNASYPETPLGCCDLDPNGVAVYGASRMGNTLSEPSVLHPLQ